MPLLVTPAKRTWTVTPVPGGGMTYETVTVTTAIFAVFGSIVWFEVFFTGTVGGTPNPVISFNLPILGNNNSGVAECVADNGGLGAGVAFVNAAAGTVDCYPGTSVATNWSAGAGRTVRCTGFYFL